jgi:hypothetical protein
MDDQDSQWAIFRRDNAFSQLTDQIAHGATFGLNRQVKPASDYLVAAGRRAQGYDAPEPSEAYQRARELEIAKYAAGRNEFGALPSIAGGIGTPRSLGSIYGLFADDEDLAAAQRAKEDDLRYAAILRALQGCGGSAPGPDLWGSFATQRPGAPQANFLASPQYAPPFVTNALADRGQRNALVP